MSTIKCTSCQKEISYDENAGVEVVRCDACMTEVPVNKYCAVVQNGLDTVMANPAAKYLPIGAAVLSLISFLLVIICLLCSGSSSESAFDFCSNPEKTAKRLFEKELNYALIKGSNQRAYVLAKNKSAALKNFSAETEECGDYVLVLWKTKVTKNIKLNGHYWLKKNRNDVYVSTYISTYSDEYNKKMSQREKEWFSDMGKKIENHEAGNDKLDWEDAK